VHASQVRRVLHVGRTLQAKRVVLFLTPGSSEVAVVASRRVGGAVQRNRARRILKEAWREVAPLAGDGDDVVIVAREAIRGAKTRDLVAEMTELLRRNPLVRT
jgi:ribonuclease P protein component